VAEPRKEGGSVIEPRNSLTSESRYSACRLIHKRTTLRLRKKLGLVFHACETAEDQYPHRITYVIASNGTIELAVKTKNPGVQADELLRYLTSSD